MTGYARRGPRTAAFATNLGAESLREDHSVVFGQLSSHLRVLSAGLPSLCPNCRHQTPIGDLLGALESGATDGGGSGELMTVPVLTAGPDGGGTELEQPTSAMLNATAINCRMFWHSE